MLYKSYEAGVRHCVIGTQELSKLEVICVYVAKENILADLTQ